MGIVERLDRYQRRHRRLALPLGVIYKFVDDQGNYLAALVTYYAIVSIFPLLLLSSTILNFVLAGNPRLQHRVLASALGQFPVVGDTLSSPHGVSGNGLGLAVGVLGTLYGALGVAQALQHAMNVMWRVPRNRRPNPVAARVRSLLLVCVIGLSVLLTTGLSAAVGADSVFGVPVGPWSTVFVVLASLLVNTAVFTLGFHVATARDISWRDTVPGAIGAAVVWQGLQYAGTAYVGHVVRHATATNSVFALVLGLIAWVYLEAVVVVLAVEFNTVWSMHLYPRALLTPFTDDVELTTADEHAYGDQARAQRAKEFEHIGVAFHRQSRRSRRQTPGDDERPATDQ